MKIYKFGGASVKDAQSVENLEKLLRLVGYPNTMIVVSAMGKTTNNLEVVIKNYLEKSPKLKESLETIKECHRKIISQLFNKNQANVLEKVKGHFLQLDNFLLNNKSTSYNFVYDQIISYGELLSSTILSEYLRHKQIDNQWIDVREFIKTDQNYRDAKVDWKQTQDNIKNRLSKDILYVTQGFLGSDGNNFTTSLGREGSDFTAAIFGYCLDADSVTIWKDVHGVLNADPKHFKETHLLKKIPYDEAIELAFYGASVIHPKTLQPLQKKNIPLYVKSFLNPLSEGSCVCDVDVLDPKIPCFIVKKNQIMLSLSTRDFSFMAQDNMGELFDLFYKNKMKIDMLQNSAISFSVCVDDKFNMLSSLLEDLSEKFDVKIYKNVTLYTVRHGNSRDIDAIYNKDSILLKQSFQETIQCVIKE